MKTVSELSFTALGILGTWQMLLFLGSVWYLVMNCREKRWTKPIIGCLLSSLMVVFNYFSFQFSADTISPFGVHDWVKRAEMPYAKAPSILVISVCAVMTVIEVLLLRSSLRWYRTHITSGSIKEAIETLPVGVCAYEDSGKVTLKNTTMEQLCRRLTGQALLNGTVFSRALEEERNGLVERTVELPGFGVWSFEKDRIGEKNDEYSLLVAYNVTEAYRKTQTLNEKRRTLEELNDKLTEYNRRIETVVAERERLAAKIRIHDELGADMLLIRHCLTSSGDEKEKEEILYRANRNVSFLLEKDEAHADEYEMVLKTAKELGVTVAIDGVLPGTEPQKHVVATAMHECLTNTLRHAHGDMLHISITETEYGTAVTLTNNGIQPTGEIREKGGLSALRALAEKAGGTMTVGIEPVFALTVTLPKEEKEYGI
ncbi:MAG: hypothetical protein MJ070_01615 [Lachnospiraceae bacterium]|nr:hypothetical protein [Lachnospiraceae bacterium]